MRRGRVVFTMLIITAALVACVAAGSMLWLDLKDLARNRSEIQDLQAEIRQLEHEAEIAASEAEAEVARARQVEAQAEIEEAQADQIRAAGEKSEREASAYVQRSLGDAARRAIDRQGRMLQLYTLQNLIGDPIKILVMGLVAGAAMSVCGLLAYAHLRELRRADSNLQTG